MALAPSKAELRVCIFLIFTFLSLRTNLSPANAQSLQDKEQNLEAKISEIASKPPEDITQQDARELQSHQVNLIRGPCLFPFATT